MPTNSLTSQGSAPAVPEPISSVMVNSGWQSIGGSWPLSRIALSAVSRAATPALSSRWRALMWPLSVNSGSGSKATKSPMDTPSASLSAWLAVAASRRSSMLSQLTGRLSTAVLKACPEAISGSTLPRSTPFSQNTVTRLPSAKRLDQQPTGARHRRPFGLIERTIAPMVSRWAETARSGLLRLPVMVARMVPRRVSSKGTPSSSRRSAT
ncbi:hypothetical protein D9M68_446600 [compost metagenome]